MLGKNANYVPGWDCHGLPIEWQIEEKYRKEGKNKDEERCTNCKKKGYELDNQNKLRPTIEAHEYFYNQVIKPWIKQQEV